MQAYSPPSAGESSTASSRPPIYLARAPKPRASNGGYERGPNFHQARLSGGGPPRSPVANDHSFDAASPRQRVSSNSTSSYSLSRSAHPAPMPALPRGIPRKSAYDTFDEIGFCNTLTSRIASELAVRSRPSSRRSTPIDPWRGKKTGSLSGSLQKDASNLADSSTQNAPDEEDATDVDIDVRFDADGIRPERTEATKAAAVAFLQRLAERRQNGHADGGEDEAEQDLEKQAFAVFGGLQGEPRGESSSAEMADSSDPNLDPGAATQIATMLQEQQQSQQAVRPQGGQPLIQEVYSSEDAPGDSSFEIQEILTHKPVVAGDAIQAYSTDDNSLDLDMQVAEDAEDEEDSQIEEDEEDEEDDDEEDLEDEEDEEDQDEDDADDLVHQHGANEEQAISLSDSDEDEIEPSVEDDIESKDDEDGDDEVAEQDQDHYGVGAYLQESQLDWDPSHHTQGLFDEQHLDPALFHAPLGGDAYTDGGHALEVSEIPSLHTSAPGTDWQLDAVSSVPSSHTAADAHPPATVDLPPVPVELPSAPIDPPSAPIDPPPAPIEPQAVESGGDLIELKQQVEQAQEINGEVPTRHASMSPAPPSTFPALNTPLATPLPAEMLNQANHDRPTAPSTPKAETRRRTRSNQSQDAEQKVSPAKSDRSVNSSRRSRRHASRHSDPDGDLADYVPDDEKRSMAKHRRRTPSIDGDEPVAAPVTSVGLTDSLLDTSVLEEEEEEEEEEDKTEVEMPKEDVGDQKEDVGDQHELTQIDDEEQRRQEKLRKRREADRKRRERMREHKRIEQLTNSQSSAPDEKTAGAGGDLQSSTQNEAILDASGDLQDATKDNDKAIEPTTLETDLVAHQSQQILQEESQESAETQGSSISGASKVTTPASTRRKTRRQSALEREEEDLQLQQQQLLHAEADLTPSKRSRRRTRAAEQADEAEKKSSGSTPSKRTRRSRAARK